MSKNLMIAGCLGSLGLLLGAFAFQYLGGLPPCKMCIWQRWPHAIAIVMGGAAIALQNRTLALIVGMIVLIGALIGFYHAGVEQGWFEGPSTCTSGDISTLTTDELLAQIQSAPLVRCDEIPWSLLGLSMAAWNGVLSLIFSGFWLASIRRTQ